MLNRLPSLGSDIFVDASSMWGIGGCLSENYFYIPWEQLVQVEEEIIARKELFACLVAILFQRLDRGKACTAIHG